MRSKALIVAGIITSGLIARPGPAIASFLSVNKFTATASATPSVASFTISVSTLPVNNVFFGKNVVIPVTLASNAPINSQNLAVSMWYQAQPTGGLPGPASNVSIAFSAVPSNPDALVGSAIIPVSELASLYNGGTLSYIFIARQGAVGVMQTGSGAAPAPPGAVTSLPSTAFSTIITNQICADVDPTRANSLKAPDLSINDGQTAVSFGAGAIMGPGQLCIVEDNSGDWPPTPGGVQPAVVYNVLLNNTSLIQTAQLVLSYPSNTNGQVLNLDADPNALGIYWLGPENAPLSAQSWRLLSRSDVDTTLHTVTGFTNHFTKFALFATGATANADLRPKERIITPNGDGVNDCAIFGAVDEVKIFDVRGRRIRDIRAPSSTCGNAIGWDGRNDDGAIVESGVYIYQFTVNGGRVSGVIGVAK